ncbi:MAG: NADH:ubiquinone oxidoreductase subunit J [Comamonadaceae bacterium CG_4_9_14_3_um_filter_60_33]|nr:MAG: NADH:ubiquinone oxidoreductase subunit J [Comamonadaceae bacterium CG2_30_59_20]PIY28835.1 MAG: NADH:ubiquinone oxidoreductase subunit J [Comamonadaceae bacterium CG_4_10_14_3_um_filter_60_42]PJB45185.1 MAG: NADH:ubiquinone oxidoreductase subunit J [Comamonadaceae bacterium CG_4_9_14_3_um_filter_60_33]
MDVKTGLFYVFATVLLLAAFRVITARNPVHSVLFLVLAFFQASMIWMLLEAEFLAIALVLVYVGAVMVLFLFVVMMLDINLDGVRQGFWNQFPMAAVVGLVIVVEMSAVLLVGFPISQAPAVMTGLGQTIVETSNTKALGVLMYTHYLYPFEVAAAILLVGMIAAIALTLRHRKHVKAVSPAEQVRVKWAERLTVVKLDATQPAASAPAAQATLEEKKA